MGQYALSAMNAGDYAAIQGVVLWSALLYVTVYFGLDTLQLILDPRTRT
jgi:ABC-type dipeptide/oligopeptide/nickel transport system permease component